MIRCPYHDKWLELRHQRLDVQAKLEILATDGHSYAHALEVSHNSGFVDLAIERSIDTFSVSVGSAWASELVCPKVLKDSSEKSYPFANVSVVPLSSYYSTILMINNSVFQKHVLIFRCIKSWCFPKI